MPIGLFVLLQRWNCVVDWSRRRSSLWCVDCPMLPWQPATRCWLFAGRNAWSQITFFVRLKPVNWSTLTSSKSENQSALKNFRFAFVLLNMKSQIGIGRIRLEFERLTWLSTCNQRYHWAFKRKPNEVLSLQLDGLTSLVYYVTS